MLLTPFTPKIVKRKQNPPHPVIFFTPRLNLFLIDSYMFFKNEPAQDERQEALEALIDLYIAWGKPVLAEAYPDSLALR